MVAVWPWPWLQGCSLGLLEVGVEVAALLLLPCSCVVVWQTQQAAGMAPSCHHSEGGYPVCEGYAALRVLAL